MVWSSWKNENDLEKINESYRMGNALAFQSISHRTGKRIKTHVMGKTWEIATHTFPILWVFFFLSNSNPTVYFIIWEMHGFPHQFPIARENATKHIIGRNWEISTNTFPIVWVLFPIQFPACVSINFPYHEKMQKKPIVRKPHGENLGNWYSYFSHNMVTFFSLESHPKVNFITGGVHVFSHHFPTNLINVESLRLEVG